MEKGILWKISPGQINHKKADQQAWNRMAVKGANQGEVSIKCV
jgi:hypothetical protein